MPSKLTIWLCLKKKNLKEVYSEFMIWKQTDLIPRGHSIECRVYAEDPYKGGMPSTGKLGAMYFPEGPGRRFEVGFEEGDEITPYYDPMVAKIIVWDESRPRAIRKMLRTLDETFVFGVRLNIPYLKAILSNPEFVDGTMTTQFISKHLSDGLPAQTLTEEQEQFAKAAYSKAAGATASAVMRSSSAINSPWTSHWRVI